MRFQAFRKMATMTSTATTTLNVAKATSSPADLRINGTRLMDSIHSTCEFGKAHPYGDHHTETGMARLALNDDDKLVRHWLIKEVEAVGCKVTVDQMGNMFAVRPGKKQGAAPIMMGSHLDTQPTGGRYDGILGVMAGLEALRTMHENDYQTNNPVGLINWTNEEGARFPMITMASGVWAGSIPLETAWNCPEAIDIGSQPKTVKQELERIGFLGDILASHKAQPIAAHFELHIEQGPILEGEQERVGVVVGAQACQWHEVEVKGTDSHAGTTPMVSRKDSLLAAAKMIVGSNEVAHKFDGLVTTGILRADPGSVNTMAHTTKFTLDMRHPKDDKLAEMVAACREKFSSIAKEDSERGVEVEWKKLTDNAAVAFHADCIKAVEEAATDVCSELPNQKTEGKLWRHMVSGAGHDSCHVNKISPTAMIFAPTRNGLSHTPVEYCKPEDCIVGAQVLLGAVLRYDAKHG